MKTWRKRGAAVLLLCLLLWTLAVPALAAEGAYALTDSQLKRLLQKETLQPQVTGCVELDAILEAHLGAAEQDPLTRLKEAYAWCITGIRYSWAPYSVQSAPAYDKFRVQHDLTYVQGLEEALPREVVNRTYHALACGEGVCYDYAAAFAVMARYIGLDAYAHTGYVDFGRTEVPVVLHHGYTVVKLGGQELVFDPQMDMRLTKGEEISYYCFGIPKANQWRYEQDEAAVNRSRDSGYLSVKADRSYTPYIFAQASESGRVSGQGVFPAGTMVHLRARAKKGGVFRGWYDDHGELLTTEPELDFPAEKTCHYRAVFNDEYFKDVTDELWYADQARELWERGLIGGGGDFCFHGDDELTRAMAVNLLYKTMEGKADPTVELPYWDVDQGAWYADALRWALEDLGLQEIFRDTDFGADKTVTKEQFLTLMVRCAWLEGLETESAYLPYYDIRTLRTAAIDALRQAQTWGLLTGDEHGAAQPHRKLTRADGAEMLLELTDLLETAA